MREKADSNVQAVLDAKIARESELKFDSVKHSVRAEESYLKAREKFPLLRGKRLGCCKENR